MTCASDILSDSGPIARRLADQFEARPEQLHMAAAVAEAMETKTHLLVEAGTGVGKSFAYLVPAMLRCLTRGQTVLVATNTIALQEQLIQKDVPLLQDIVLDALKDDPALIGPDGISRTLRPLLVKGRGNYVSVRRLKLASERQDRLFPDAAALRSLHMIEDWVHTTPDGTLSTLPQLERPGIWDKVQSDSGNCMGRKCPTFGKCFYQSARAQLDGANLLICNHALFFSDLALRAQDVGFLPKYDHVILDEAHNVEDVASDHFGISLGEGRINHLLSTLYHPRTGKGYLAQLGLVIGDVAVVDKAILLVQQCQNASRDFFEALVNLARSDDSRGPLSYEPSRSARIRSAGAVTNVLTPAMRELALRLKSVKETIKAEPDRFELNAYSLRAEMIANDAEALVSQSVPKCAYWVEVSGGDDEGGGGGGGGGGGFGGSRYQKVTFACSPVEVRELLKARLFSQEHSVVLTSATLATRTVRGEETRESSETAFSHAMARLGCEGARALQLGSPFDYARQVRFYVDSTMGESRGGSRGDGDSTDAGFAPLQRPSVTGSRRAPATSNDRLAAQVLNHVRATNGGAFVLFTSFATLNAVASRLAGPLAELGLPLLAQGRDGSRTLILQRFRENPSSVLFGAASFWQGVDVRGQGLRNVIITKLPFDPPDRPLTQARLELIESRGGNAFMEDSIPRAVIKFKQGFGRLIRSKTDTGRVVLLDPRVLTARYGRLFLNALPEGLEVRTVDDEYF